VKKILKFQFTALVTFKLKTKLGPFPEICTIKSYNGILFEHWINKINKIKINIIRIDRVIKKTKIIFTNNKCLFFYETIHR